MIRCLVCLTLALAACATTPKAPPTPPTPPPDAASVRALVDEASATLGALELEVNRAWFAASVSGSDADWQRSGAADIAMNTFLADGALFARVRAARDAGLALDPLLARELEQLYLAMLGKQVPPAELAEITRLEKELEQRFNAYRGEVGGAALTQNEINKILRTSTDSAALEQAWLAQKGIGPLVEAGLKELVGLRNQVAKKLGFRDFYALRLAESEIDEAELLALFDELDTLTRAPFTAAKAEVDRRLAKRLKLTAEGLRPWHYQNAFFQEPPEVFATGMAAAYEKQEPLALCRLFFRGVELEIEPILARSDLYEKPGKTPHAFSANIDRAQDVRVLANVVPGEEWTATMMHELGHAVYDAAIDPSLPWLLREPAHSLTTEGVAMMFERLVNQPKWAEGMGVLSAKQARAAAAEARAQQAFGALLFSRWAQVMLRFERAMYGDPTQDLNALWWSLVEQYQGIAPPPGRNAPDYATKIHMVIVPVYYHNYMLGSLFAAQLHEKLAEVAKDIPASATFIDQPAIGAYLREQVFAPGARYPWKELVERATGAPLSPAAFARAVAP